MHHLAARSKNRVYYSFVKQHKTLRVTPAMAARLTKRFMSVGDIANWVIGEVIKKTNF
jgi:hypothetical protein